MYEIIVNNKHRKTYPTRDQCVAWCYSNGKVLLAKGSRYLACTVVIKKVSTTTQTEERV